ncbi:hypothetical protein [Emticicia oligotrophica]|uniref:hypothetical protein n=1 Tax=Emticicia oligotrophica TaxID=312279 RepID=UPI00273A94D5|nr:hypothetical protein [Emticicia oligotrophica]
MRKISKPLHPKPAILDFTKTPYSLVVLEEIITKKRVENEHSNIYRGTYKDTQGLTKSSVLDELNKVYHEKCAYCESFESNAQIEHFRPKNKVTSAGKNNGYYWLCFEWTNLVPACFECNKIGSGKANKFPIISTQRKFEIPLKPDSSLNFDSFLYDSQHLSSEKPFLIHPEYDNPKLFFKFGWTNSHSLLNLIGKDTESRGKETIKICNLNRTNLGRNRSKRLNDVIIEPIKESLALFLNNQKTLDIFSLDMTIIFKKLKSRASDEKEEFTLMWWYIYESVENFEKIIGVTLPEGTQRNVVINLFRQFKDNP